jgi:spore coat polysaccharide biosynthesis protein SpsF
MWTYFEDTGIFNVGVLPVKEKIYFNNEIRATLDYEDDFLFFKKIFEHFKCDENNVPLKDIAAYLNENPEIVKINAFRRLEWENNQKMKTKLVLKKTKN